MTHARPVLPRRYVRVRTPPGCRPRWRSPSHDPQPRWTGRSRSRPRGNCATRSSAYSSSQPPSRPPTPSTPAATRSSPPRCPACSLKPSGLSLGDWHTALKLALEPTVPGRLVPELRPLFFLPNGRRTPLNRAIDGDIDSFVKWRNDVFGHGVFRQEREWYAAQTLRWLPRLAEFAGGIRAALTGRVLTSEGPWRRASRVGRAGRPVVRPAARTRRVGAAATAFAHLRRPGGPAAVPTPVRRAVRRMHGLPVVSSSTSTAGRGEGPPPHAPLGVPRRARRRLPRLGRRRRSPPACRRSSSGSGRPSTGGEVDTELRKLFRDFADEYRRPGHLLDVVWGAVEERPKGYVHVVGPGGVGKTFLVGGLRAEGKDRGAAVVSVPRAARARGPTTARSWPSWTPRRASS